MFHVIPATDPRWVEFVACLPYDVRDVHLLPGYVHSHAGPGEEALLAVWEDTAGGYVTLQPFILRPIEWSGYDLTSPGYGGPFTSAALVSPQAAVEFHKAFADWRRGLSVITQFYRINPATAAHQWPLIKGNPVVGKAVVMLPLADAGNPPGMRESRAHAISKMAEREVNFEISAPPPSIAEFAALYGEAMDAKNASKRWRKDADFFAGLASNLGGFLTQVAARYGDAYAAALFAMGTGTVAHYEFAATTPHPPQGLTDSIIIMACGRARAAGCQWMHLGGGVTSAPDDSLLAYKRSFGGVLVDTYMVQSIYDMPAYLALTRAAKIDHPWRTSFFPAYRASEAT